MSAEPKIEVSVERRFDAPPSTVFDAWLDPDKAGRFLFATPTGRMVATYAERTKEGWASILEGLAGALEA